MTLLDAESSASYGSGHLLFARDGTLMAQPFDPGALRPTGDPFPLAEHVSREASRYVGASVSENGTLVYGRDDSLTPTQLTWLDRSGHVLGTLGEPARYTSLALSPDESRVAVALGTGSPENVDIWIIDTARNVPSRVTDDAGFDGPPVWSPDGTRIAFGHSRSGKGSLRQKLINETAEESLFEVSGTPSRPCDASRGITCTVWPNGWSADGRFIAYTLRGSFPLTSDVWVLPLSGDRNPFSLAQTAFLEAAGVFSPDGKWIAYTTNEAGQPDVYVQPFLRPGGKYPVSKDGGTLPAWRADGKELFYVTSGGTLMSVPIDATDHFKAGVPQALFAFRLGAPTFNQVYAVTKDGKRFLVNARPQQSSAAPLTVVLNWTAAIQK